MHIPSNKEGFSTGHLLEYLAHRMSSHICKFGNNV